MAISDQQPRRHQPEAIGGPGDKNPTHRDQCRKDAHAVNPKPATTDANSASKASPAPPSASGLNSTWTEALNRGFCPGDETLQSWHVRASIRRSCWIAVSDSGLTASDRSHIAQDFTLAAGQKCQI